MCSKVFSRKDSLNLHFRTHNGIKPFKCEHCTKGFSQKSSVTKHLRRHTDAKLFKCSFCLKEFSLRDTCARHQRSHSVAEEEPPIIEGFLEKRNGEALAQLAQEEQQLQANIEFFECKKGLLFMALFDDFQENRAFKTVKGDWMVSTQRGRSRLAKAKRFAEVTEFVDLQVAVWDGTLKAGKVLLQEKLIKKEANRQRIKGTDVRSNSVG